MSIAENVARIRAEMEAAALACGRDPKSIQLCAATKMNDADAVRQAIAGGVDLCGENRVQEFLSKYDALRGTVPLHLIGHLQTNKVKYIIDKVKMIHSLDSLKLAAEIDKQAKKRGIVIDVLVEVNCGEEENKSGLFPSEVEEFCLCLSQFGNIRHRGFMTMAPKCEKKEEYFNYFQETSQLVLDIWQEKLHNIYKNTIICYVFSVLKELLWDFLRKMK